MKRVLIWTTALAAAACLTAAWAQHGQAGGGAGAHGAPRFGNGSESHATGSSAQKTSTSGSKATTQTDGVESSLANHPNLSSRLQPLLPAGTSLQSAAAGFKNEGQFIAALHVSHNLNIPLSQLKSGMTSGDHDSLGRAIHDLRPDLGSKTVKSSVKVAERQAKKDLKESSEAAKPAKEKESQK